MPFELNYQKNNNEKLFRDLEKFLAVERPQNYIPIYNKYFELNETNYNNINLNQKFSLNEIVETLEGLNTFKCSLKNSQNETTNKNVFFKFSPLLDPVKYMIGKYDASDLNLLSIPDFMNKNCHPKSRDSNNSAYVDGLFNYLTSQLLHNHGFVNGLDFYGLFLGTKRDFVVNVVDDLEYLVDSEFFNKNKGDLFKIDNQFHNELLNAESRNYKKRLVIKEDDPDQKILLTLDDIEKLDDIDNLFKPTVSNSVTREISESKELEESKEGLIYENNHVFKKSHSRSSGSTCSSRTSNTDENSQDDKNENDSEDKSEDKNEDDDNSDENSGSVSGSETGSEYSSSSDDVVNATVAKFPVSIICLEKCCSTLDELMFSNELSTKEWSAILMQVIMILVTYQKTFSFTHNDLHTNNIMYIETDKEFLYYKYNNKHYKVPTYGRLFKIIDFGRAIYKFKGVQVCSDSFHKNGDAATQYNFEPYINVNKPRLEPNYSFDLCRLACSMYDFLIPDGDVDKTPITSLINEWCKDDKGRNVLYKTDGEERYPNFKLYKMIARTVHNKVPSQQLKQRIFAQYEVTQKNIKNVSKTEIMNIDDIPIYACG